MKSVRTQQGKKRGKLRADVSVVRPSGKGFTVHVPDRELSVLECRTLAQQILNAIDDREEKPKYRA